MTRGQGDKGKGEKGKKAIRKPFDKPFDGLRRALRTAQENNKWKGCFIYSAVLLLVVSLVCGIGALTAGRFLASTDSLSPADAIVVLGGGSSDFPRVQHAVQLFRQGYASAVVFSGPPSKYADLPCSEAQQSLQVAHSLGLPAGAGIVIHGAQSTYDEAVKLRQLAEQNGWHSLVVVTDLFHTRRAGRTFHTLLPDVTIHVSATPDPDYDAGRWWQTEDSLVAVFTEMIKLVFYWLKYDVAPVG